MSHNILRTFTITKHELNPERSIQLDSRPQHIAFPANSGRFSAHF